VGVEDDVAPAVAGPAQRRSGLRGLSAMAVIDPFLVRVSSGETAFRLDPRLTDRNTYWAPQ
jgi:hypothetical protein